MGYDLRRAATALLACLAVALAAMLLPAAGIGSYPGVVGEPVPGAGPDGVTGPGVDPGPDDTSGDDPTGDATTGEETTGEAGSDSGGDDGTDTTTQEQTSTADEGDTGGSDSGGDLLAGAVGFLVVLLQAVTLFALLGTGLLVLGLIVGGLNAGPVRLLSRDGSSGGGMLLEVFGTQVSLGGLQTLSQGSLRLVLGLSRSTGTLLSGLGKAAGDAVSALSTGGSLVAGVGSAFGALGGGLARALKGGGVVGSLTLGMGSLTTGLANWRSSFDRGDSPTSDARGVGPVPDPEASEEDEPVDPGPQSVEEAWERFVERVPLRCPEVRTPGEVARTAVRDDWPAGPVRRLTHAFREVRYGGVPADEGRTRGATSALDRMDDGGEGE